MNEQKAVRPGSAGPKLVRSEFSAGKPLKPEATMHTQAAIRKAGGRLSREDQRRLGDILQRVYDDVVRQGVPDRFRNLMDELEGDPQRGDVGNALAPQQAQGGRDPESDRVVAAKSFPHDKGSSQ
jgi:hypothetical protein